MLPEVTCRTSCQPLPGSSYHFWGHHSLAASQSVTPTVCLRTVWKMRCKCVICEIFSDLPVYKFSRFILVKESCLLLRNWNIWFREAPPPKKKVKFGKVFPNVGGWGVWFPNKVQTPQNPPKSPRKLPFLTQISPFVFPNLTKTLGWVNRFGKGFPKKNGFFLAASLKHLEE